MLWQTGFPEVRSPRRDRWNVDNWTPLFLEGHAFCWGSIFGIPFSFFFRMSQKNLRVGFINAQLKGIEDSMKNTNMLFVPEFQSPHNEVVSLALRAFLVLPRDVGCVRFPLKAVSLSAGLHFPGIHMKILPSLVSTSCV